MNQQIINSGVYRIEITTPDGVYFYIGGSGDLKHRWGQWQSSLRCNRRENPRMQDLFHQHGFSAFTFTPMILCQPEHVLELETFLYSKHEGDSMMLNCGPPGAWNKGMKMDEKTRRKMSKAGKGKQISAETRTKISDSLTGKGKGYSFSNRHQKYEVKFKWNGKITYFGLFTTEQEAIEKVKEIRG